jgi:hypothetical protein
LQILKDPGKILVIPVSRPAASYYPNILIQVLGLIFYLYIVFFCPVCASVMRGRTVYRETGRKETRGERKEKRGENRGKEET